MKTVTIEEDIRNMRDSVVIGIVEMKGYYV